MDRERREGYEWTGGGGIVGQGKIPEKMIKHYDWHKYCTSRRLLFPRARKVSKAPLLYDIAESTDDEATSPSL